MKMLLAIFSAVLGFQTLRAAEHVTLIGALQSPNVYSSETITLNQGDLAEMIYAPIQGTEDRGATILFTSGISGASPQSFSAILTPPWHNEPIPYGTSSIQKVYDGVPRLNSIKVAGPGTIKITSQGMATFSITRASAPSVTPSNAVVIPSDAAGNFQVILESSTDMITWTAAIPGTYSGNTQGRFFRTRVVKL